MSKVMVIDDSDLARAAVARLMEQEGHTTHTAANGKEAWAMLYAGLPDLIVLDLMMPLMDGLTFLRVLRQSPQWNHVRVTILTGHSDKDDLVSQARALGVSDVIEKGTLDAHDLLDRLTRQLPVIRKRRGHARSTERHITMV